MRRHHDQCGTGRSAPPLLRRCQQHINARFFQIHKHRAAGNTIQNKQSAMFMYSISNSTDKAVRHHQASRGFHMRAADHIRLFRPDRGNNLVQRDRCKRCIACIFQLTGSQNRCRRRQTASLDNLRPAKAEPAIADHQHLGISRELARNRLHPVGATTRHHSHRGRPISGLHDPRNVAHHMTKGI